MIPTRAATPRPKAYLGSRACSSPMPWSESAARVIRLGWSLPGSCVRLHPKLAVIHNLSKIIEVREVLQQRTDYLCR